MPTNKALPNGPYGGLSRRCVVGRRNWKTVPNGRCQRLASSRHRPVGQMARWPDGGASGHLASSPPLWPYIYLRESVAVKGKEGIWPLGQLATNFGQGRIGQTVALALRGG